MKKNHILKKNEDYNRIIQNITPLKYKDYLIYLERTNDDSYYFGFSVGKKVGNAVTRNKIKRQLKNILRENSYQNGFNCIIMVKKGILEKEFPIRRKYLLEAIDKLKIVKEKK